jgi:hypothetical protein
VFAGSLRCTVLIYALYIFFFYILICSNHLHEKNRHKYVWKWHVFVYIFKYIFVKNFQSQISARTSLMYTLYTHSVMFTCTSVISARRVISRRTSVNLTRKSVILTRKRLSFIHRMRFPQAECDFYTKSVISKHKGDMNVIMTLTSVITTRTIMIFTRLNYI